MLDAEVLTRCLVEPVEEPLKDIFVCFSISSVDIDTDGGEG
jgi:hypothetical protein